MKAEIKAKMKAAKKAKAAALKNKPSRSAAEIKESADFLKYMAEKESEKKLSGLLKDHSFKIKITFVETTETFSAYDPDRWRNGDTQTKFTKSNYLLEVTGDVIFSKKFTTDVNPSSYDFSESITWAFREYIKGIEIILPNEMFYIEQSDKPSLFFLRNKPEVNSITPVITGEWFDYKSKDGDSYNTIQATKDSAPKTYGVDNLFRIQVYKKY